jgi:hypothetical protein
LSFWVSCVDGVEFLGYIAEFLEIEVKKMRLNEPKPAAYDLSAVK